MAWVEQRKKKWRGYYRDPRGKKHSAGSFDGKRKAKREALKKEEEARSGFWADPKAGDSPSASTSRSTG